jgi:SERRATE/Ars2, N-terminal domain
MQSRYGYKCGCPISIDISIKVQILFEKHHTAAWFLEKYDPTEKYSDLRARVRKQGWHGALDHFLDELESGKFDHIAEAAKTTTATTVASAEKAEPQNGEIPATVAAEETPEEKKEDKALKPEDEEDKVDDDVEWNVNGDSDEVVIPHKGHQVMIKTIPPEIGRLRLEPVCFFKPWN